MTNNTPPTGQQLTPDREQEIRTLDLEPLMDDRSAAVISGHLAVLLGEIDRLRTERGAQDFDPPHVRAARYEAAGNVMAASLVRDGFGDDEIANMLGPGVTDGAAPEPTMLRWGLDDVMYGDDDSTIVMLSGPAGEPYWLELDPERAAVLREDLAGPDGAETDDEPALSTRQCGHDDYHDAHEWADKPGVWCPGHSAAAVPAPAGE